MNNILLKEMAPHGILRLTLNDSKRRNALSEAMLSSLNETISGAGRDNEIRVIILSSNGPAFSAGHDLKELTRARNDSDGGREYFAKIMTMCSTVMQTIVNCPKIIIAEVSGVATAAGCQLVASCDLAIAADTAKFATPGVNIGLFCSTPMVALSRNLSNKHTMEMLLTGDMIPAKRAAEIGLINDAVPLQILHQRTMELAEKIASKSMMTIAIGKKAFYIQKDKLLPEAYEYTSRTMVENMLIDDALEGINAFVEKRNPIWSDK